MKKYLIINYKIQQKQKLKINHNQINNILHFKKIIFFFIKIHFF